ncbi:hypothetical protein B0H14DRAFT_2592698 [Mycena olivaceomarginata]|nr:hypothetical protein B0H14DRAFT_2592698 [Mycena olivaceomarginata]
MAYSSLSPKRQLPAAPTVTPPPIPDDWNSLARPRAEEASPPPKLPPSNAFDPSDKDSEEDFVHRVEQSPRWVDHFVPTTPTSYIDMDNRGRNVFVKAVGTSSDEWRIIQYLSTKSTSGLHRPGVLGILVGVSAVGRATHIRLQDLHPGNIVCNHEDTHPGHTICPVGTAQPAFQSTFDYQLAFIDFEAATRPPIDTRMVVPEYIALIAQMTASEPCDCPTALRMLELLACCDLAFSRESSIGREAQEWRPWNFPPSESSREQFLTSWRERVSYRCSLKPLPNQRFELAGLIRSNLFCFVHPLASPVPTQAMERPLGRSDNRVQTTGSWVVQHYCVNAAADDQTSSPGSIRTDLWKSHS